MANRLVAGTFDAESYWRDESLARLPALRDRESERIVLAMDELLFPLCGSGDALLTRFAMEESHKTYLSKIGFSFTHFNLNGKNAEPNLFKTLAGSEARDENYSAYRYLSPFSIVPYTHAAAAQYGFKTELPSLEAVKSVNSKIYSTQLSEKLLGETRGKPVYSAEELSVFGLELLETHGPTLIKDPYGVSGKGNMLIQSKTALDRTAAYIRKQEENGRSAAFVLEPYLEVESDFSCQFEIMQGGAFRLVSLQKILNRQFAYLGSVSMEKEEQNTLEKNGYFDIMEQAAWSLYRDGYFGPVCIDSMTLRDGTLVPIVEINARQSMGFINHHLDQVLGRNGKKGLLTFRSIGFRERVDYEGWLNELKRQDILYPNQKGNGIVPLSSAALLANAPTLDDEAAPESGGYYKGRLYMSIVSDDDMERERYLDRLRLIFERRGGKWHS
ncbi:hypothetical protein [Paenibacillus sp. LPE1-1-1.1]|uniref:hypothetical protein n=1 Tax=Paenibacillus sp. LPE1-1-1.1 TaxID=3135230 RepID=UPI003418BD10